MSIPPEVQMKAMNVNNQGRPTLAGPGRIDEASLRQWRANNRLQSLKFDLAKSLTRDYSTMPGCDVPRRTLFSQMLAVVDRFLEEKIIVPGGHDAKDVFASPYFGWASEILVQAIRPDTSSGEAPELPIYERHRPYGSTFDVDFWTSRPVSEAVHSHVNYVVADTAKWEQSTAYYLDKHANVTALVKNTGLGFAIPYIFNGEPHDYVPDFLVKLRYKDGSVGTVILEVKGYDPLYERKADAARRWISAVNAEGGYGKWQYARVSDPTRTNETIMGCLEGWVR
jgi:type III restriction enzyme